MAFDLSYGETVYRWWGRAPVLYRLACFIMFFGLESHLRNRAAQLTGLLPDDEVLDLGCGPGVNLPFLEDRVGPSGQVIEFDYGETMLKSAAAAARRGGWHNVELMRGDAARMEMAERSLDGALCTLALSAMPDHISAVRNVHRALKPGRRFVVLDLAPFSGPSMVLNPLMKPIYLYTTNWDDSKDIPGTLRQVFGEVSVEKYLGNSILIAWAQKPR